MKTQLWLIGLVTFLVGCRHKEPAPVSTQINMTVVDEARRPIPSVEIVIGGSMGDYFSGTRKDTTLVPTNQLYTDSKGFAHYTVICSPKWELTAKPIPPFDSTGLILLYDLIKLEGTVHDAVIRVGEVNNITAIMRKR